MKRLTSILIALALCVSLFCVFSSSASAASFDNSLPHPDEVLKQVDGIMDMLQTSKEKVPDGCSFTLIDLGPNWNSNFSDDSKVVNGRYLYIFNGHYNASYGHVVAGPGNHSSPFYFWTEGDTASVNSIMFMGPYAMVSYNSDTRKLYLESDSYSDWYAMGSVGVQTQNATLELTGIVADTDTSNPDFYPRIITFADSALDSMVLGSYTLTNDISTFDWTGDFIGEIDEQKSTLDKILYYVSGEFIEDWLEGTGIFDRISALSNSVIDVFDGLWNMVGNFDIVSSISNFFKVFTDSASDFYEWLTDNSFVVALRDFFHFVSSLFALLPKPIHYLINFSFGCVLAISIFKMFHSA